MKSEAHRIAALPDSSISIDEGIIAQINEQLSTPLNRAEQRFTLKPLQVLSLLHASAAGGLLGALGCGVGKTLLSAVLPTFLRAERPLLLVPAALVEKTRAEFAEWSVYYEIRPIKVISYERISRDSGLNELTSYAPDLLICDEAHYLKDLSSARTLRIGGYLERNQSVRAIFLSGTLLNRSIGNVAHLGDWALAESSPFPRELRTVAEWDNILYGETNEFALQRFSPLLSAAGLTDPAKALYEKLRRVSGVVLTHGDTVESSLQINKVFLQIPRELQEQIKKCLEEGVLAGFEGVEDLDALSASGHLWESTDDFILRALSQMYSGFLYYWAWPNNVRDEEWLSARRNWSRTARRILEMQLPHFDTLGLIENNFEQLPREVARAAESAYHQWFSTEMYKKDPPPKKEVWVSDYLIESVGKLLSKIKEPTLIWVNFTALAERMSSILKIAYVGGGEEIPAYEGQHLILSLKSHATGKNLQAWHNNIVAAPISDPAMWEQLLARTHRMGQRADTVNVYTFQHAIFGSSFNHARSNSKVIGVCTGSPRRINYADILRYDL